VKADQAQIKAGKDARAAAADALWTRAVMERIRRAPACQPEAAPDPNDIEARAKLLLSCSRLVETGAVGRTLVDQLHVLQGQYLDWGHLRYAKMAGAPGRVHYEHGAERMEGTYDNLTIYWANLPLAAVLRLIPMHLKKMAPASDWPEAEERGATRVTVAGQPALLFQGWNDGIWLATRTSRFDLQVDASSRATAMRLAEIGLAEQPVTPQVADAVLADLKPPVAVRGIRALMGLVSQPGVTPALRRSASLVAEGRFGEAAMAIPGPIADCNPRRTLYAFGAGGQPSATPALPDAGPAIACWSEGSGRQYLLLQYDSPAARREAAATLVAVLDLLPGRQMLVGDLHQHSNVSDGMGEPQEMFFQTVSHFTDFHSLTDHNEVKGAQAIAAELPSWGMDYPFFVGEEVTRDFAHIVAVDPDGRVDEKGEPAEVVKRIHDSGAVSILAHPWDTPFQKTYRKNPFAQPKIDVFQHNPLWYAQWRRNGTIPPMVEVTDTHDMSLAWPYRGIVFAEKPTNASIKQALLDGDCCAWTPVGPRGPERIARVVWALISDREYYEDQQLQRLVKRVMELK
jgi:hypothetical protein